MKVNQLKELIKKANHYRDMYYNHNTSLVSDEQYDALFDEIEALEKETGVIFPNSPTQSVGYKTVSKLQKYIHETPLLSLGKTQDISDIAKFMRDGETYLGLKLDGLTTELIYEDGELVLASTRGDGFEGEVVTHNAYHIGGIPKKISYKERLRVVGESFIRMDDFADYIAETGEVTPARNVAAGSIRQFSSEVCAKRKLFFVPFSVLNGFDNCQTKIEKMSELEKLGFERNFYVVFPQPTNGDYTNDVIQNSIDYLVKCAKENGIPIDGLVLSYNDVKYSQSLGRTEHHFKDGIAFKFYDEKIKTKFRGVELRPTRTGMVSITILFDKVVIDDADVCRATGHNYDIFNEFQFGIGDVIEVYKANQIIPQVHQNLTKSNTYKIPMVCPCCGSELVVRAKKEANFLFCDNPKCTAKMIRRFAHFVSKPCANIDGLSESTIEKFVALGWIKNLSDIYKLHSHKQEIISLEGFGEQSCNNLLEAIENSRRMKLENYLTAVGIPNIGKKTARDIATHFGGDCRKFRDAVSNAFDFTNIQGIGDIIHRSIHEWFEDEFEQNMVAGLEDEIEFIAEQKTVSNNINFSGKTFVVTGTLLNYTRDSIVVEIEKFGGKVVSSVSKKTDYLLAGEKAGSKLDKAKNLGITILTEDDFEKLKTN